MTQHDQTDWFSYYVGVGSRTQEKSISIGGGLHHCGSLVRGMALAGQGSLMLGMVWVLWFTLTFEASRKDQGFGGSDMV